MQIEKKLYSEQVLDIIKNDLLLGSLLPGDKVNEVQLAQRLGVSRAPVREALCLLEREGLIVSENSKGKFIKKLSEKEIFDSYTTSGVLEGYSTAKNIHLFKDSDFEKLNTILQEVINIEGERNQYLEFDKQFHETILENEENKTLIHISRQLSRNLSSFLLSKYWQEISTPKAFYERHLEILDCLITREPKRIEECIYSHYESLANRIIKLVRADC